MAFRSMVGSLSAKERETRRRCSLLVNVSGKLMRPKDGLGMGAPESAGAACLFAAVHETRFIEKQPLITR